MANTASLYIWFLLSTKAAKNSNFPANGDANTFAMIDPHNVVSNAIFTPAIISGTSPVIALARQITIPTTVPIIPYPGA